MQPSHLQVQELATAPIQGVAVRRFRLTNANGMRVDLMSYGATIL